MDANGSRYHALVSEGDWTGCLPATDGDPRFVWRNGALVLRPLLFEFRSGVGTNAPLTEESGREGVFDAYGNLYSLAPDHHSVRIRSAGSGVHSDFWPVSGATAGESAHDAVGEIAGYRGGERTPSAGYFQPATPAGSAPGLPRLDAIAVSSGHYLVAASQGAGGLLIFDLYGGGPPLFQSWPAIAQGPAEALVALDDGGVGALLANRLLRTGPDLKPRVPRHEQPPVFAPPPLPVEAVATAGGEPCELDLGPA